MNLGTELQFTLAYFISFILQSIFYGKRLPTKAFGSELTFKCRVIGIYFMIFAAFVRIQYKRRNSNGPLPVAKAFLVYLVSANFFACTAYLAVDITAYRTQALAWILASNALYTCIDFISQVILVNFLNTPPLTRVADFFNNKDIPMLDDVAPTMDYDCPDRVNTRILRC